MVAIGVLLVVWCGVAAGGNCVVEAHPPVLDMPGRRGCHEAVVVSGWTRALAHHSRALATVHPAAMPPPPPMTA